MNCKLIWSAFVLALTTTGAIAQDIPQSQVPAVVVNSFQQKFPKAKKVEWEVKGNVYEVEFETGLFGTDQEAWFQPNGKVLRYKTEISKKELPKSVLDRVKRDFPGYRIEDSKKITAEQKVSYAFEVKNGKEEWKLVLDPQGNVLTKVRD
ncbi:PepSY-like domain-containing protein [Sphingobacterium multivorum]|uniref:PepSY-like domain-containing protein n=1 Tax=Sphingobacterium multivorum TaxID=28454 RepID=UPI0031BAFD21